MQSQLGIGEWNLFRIRKRWRCAKKEAKLQDILISILLVVAAAHPLKIKNKLVAPSY